MIHGRINALMFVLVLLVGTPACEDARAEQQAAGGKKELTLERLYRYPTLEGTAPQRAKWSEDGRYLAFLWNDEGMPFRDLWLYDAESGERTRLTRLDRQRDQWTLTPMHKDPKLKKFLPPERGLSDFEWADDSKKIAFAFRGEIYLVRVPEGELTRLTKSEGAESRPRFSPDSHRLAYAGERELWVQNLVTGQRTQLTTGGSDDILNGALPFPGSDRRTFAWSPDGAWLAFMQINREGRPTRLIPDYVGEEVTVRKQRRTFARDETSKVRLGLVPAEGGEVVWLTAARREYIYDWRWAPDGERLAVLRVTEDWKKRHLDMIDVAAAQEAKKKAGETDESKQKEETQPEKKRPEWIRRLLTETDDKWMCTKCDFVEWSPEGKWLLLSSERDGWNHLYLVKADSRKSVTWAAGSGNEPLRSIEGRGSPRQLTHGEWEVETSGRPLDQRPRFRRDGKAVYFTANKEDASRRDLYRVDVETGVMKRLTSKKGYNATAVAPDDERIALLYSSIATPWDLYLRPNRPEAGWQRVTASPLDEFDDYQWPQPRIVEFPSRDGETVRALLFPPTKITAQVTMAVRLPGARPPKRREKGPAKKVVPVPVVNFVHGAGYAQAVLDRWGGYYTPRFQFNQFLTQHGYAVIDVDYRGSAGYGRAWRTDVYLHLGGKDLEDELAAMDYLKTLAWVDTGRAGIWGVSYGGFMTLMAMFLSPDTFQAGSAWAAVADWANYQRHYTQQRLRTPESHPEAYQRSSPIHHIEGLKNPLQIQHGMRDDNVHFQDAVQLVNALVEAGKEFDLVFYPLSDHGWTRPAVWIHSTRKMFEFFERHLKGELAD